MLTLEGGNKGRRVSEQQIRLKKNILFTTVKPMFGAAFTDFEYQSLRLTKGKQTEMKVCPIFLAPSCNNLLTKVCLKKKNKKIKYSTRYQD